MKVPFETLNVRNGTFMACGRGPGTAPRPVPRVPKVPFTALGVRNGTFATPLVGSRRW
ncbi:hypothetical protein GCM10010174_77150 [Kutzneria viridogrisea]|uniref:Uncharacterized protein n=1 Tax=Kutzneria viridogrisea TaxID=47990 RepID=A0ABR6BNR1_9PSEU|nr:hypothetical protein [Kutzneria viridogrisea]